MGPGKVPLNLYCVIAGQTSHDDGDAHGTRELERQGGNGDHFTRIHTNPAGLRGEREGEGR